MKPLQFALKTRNKASILTVGVFACFTAIYFLFIAFPDEVSPSLKFCLELVFVLLVLLSLPLNHYLTGTGILLLSVFFAVTLAFASLRVLGWGGMIILPVFACIQILDQRLRNRILVHKQSLDLELEQARERLRDKNALCDALDGKRLALARQIRRFSNLRNYLTQINLALSNENLADLVLNFVSESLPHSDIYTLALLNKREKLITKSFIVKGRTENLHLRPDQTDIFNEWVMTYRSPLTVKNTNEDYRFQGRGERPLLYPFSKSIIASPLISDDKPMGLLRVDSVKPNQFQISDFRFLVIIANVSALSLKNAELIRKAQKLSITDGLTGLYRSHVLFQNLEKWLTRSPDDSRPKKISLLMMDLDHFKSINDKFGHVIGDQILIQSSRILTRFCPKGGYAIRYGGEEFALLLPGLSRPEARIVAEKIRSHFTQKKIIIRRESIKLSVSTGIAAYPEDSKEAHSLIRIADERLYQAKHGGRNRTVG